MQISRNSVFVQPGDHVYSTAAGASGSKLQVLRVNDEPKPTAACSMVEAPFATVVVPVSTLHLAAGGVDVALYIRLLEAIPVYN